MIQRISNPPLPRASATTVTTVAHDASAALDALPPRARADGLRVSAGAALTQWLIAQGCAPQSSVEAFLARWKPSSDGFRGAGDAVDEEEDDGLGHADEGGRVARAVRRQNEALAALGLEIRASVSDGDGEKYYAVVGRDPAPPAASAWEHERAFWRALLTEMLGAAGAPDAQGRAGTAFVTHIAATKLLRAHARARAPSDAAAAAVLAELVRAKWLAPVLGAAAGAGADRLTLGVRALSDLAPLLVEELGDARPALQCRVCDQLALDAQLCPNPACPVRLHRVCAENMRARLVRLVCPKCRKPF